jgi:hypothetical protein
VGNSSCLIDFKGDAKYAPRKRKRRDTLQRSDRRTQAAGRFLERNMKTTLNILGVLMLLFGGVWFLQGINVIHQGFMAGQTKWEINGSILFVADVVVLLCANLKRKAA